MRVERFMNQFIAEVNACDSKERLLPLLDEWWTRFDKMCAAFAVSAVGELAVNEYAGASKDLCGAVKSRILMRHISDYIDVVKKSLYDHIETKPWTETLEARVDRLTLGALRGMVRSDSEIAIRRLRTTIGLHM